MPVPLSQVLIPALAAAGLSQHAFCRLVGYNQGSLQSVLKQRRRPPLESAEEWAKALGLKGEARHEFLLAYWLAHSPPQVAAEIDRLRAARK